MVGTVLITGASSGIGAATARYLVLQGFRVFGTYRSTDPPQIPIEWIQMDIRDEQSVRRGVAQILKKAGRLDSVVCNAGFSIFGSIEEVPIEDAVSQFETNVFGTLRTLAATLPHMRKAKRGRIVIVGSLSGRAPVPFQAHYSASKAALDALTQALRNEVRSFGVLVSLVEPGDINTRLNDRIDFSIVERSAYGDRIRGSAEVIRAAMPSAPGPQEVARAIGRALTEANPRPRYPVGPDSRLVPLARRFLPENVCLDLIRHRFKV